MSDPKYSQTLTWFQTLRSPDTTEEQRAKIRDRIITANINLVRSLAYRYKKNSWLSYDALFSAGVVGLIKAVDRFNLDLEFEFSSYAVPKIESELLHLIRDSPRDGITIPRTSIEFIQYVNRQSRQLERDRDDVAIAILTSRSVDNPIQRWQQIQQDCERHPVRDLDEIQIEATEDESDRVTAVRSVLATLPYQMAQALLMFGQGCDMSAIANRLGLSLNDAAQLLEDGKQRMLEREDELL